MTTANEVKLDFCPADRIVDEMNDNGGVSADSLIPLLQRIQDEYGYLPPPILVHVSERTGIPTSRMYGVITFYAQFYTEPHGKYTIRCCRGTACHVKGGHRIAQTVKHILNVDEGDTTADMKFTFETVACLGTCFLAPVMMVGNDYYGQLKADRVSSILESYK